MKSYRQMMTVSSLLNNMTKQIKEMEHKLPSEPALLGGIILDYLHEAYSEGKKEGEKQLQNMMKNN